MERMANARSLTAPMTNAPRYCQNDRESSEGPVMHIITTRSIAPRAIINRDRLRAVRHSSGTAFFIWFI